MHNPAAAGADVATMKPSGVAHVFNRMNPGGAELRTIEVVRRTGAAFDFIATSGLRGSLDDQLRAEGHGVHHVRLSPKNLWPFASLLRAGRHRVVHSHLGLASGPVLMLAWSAGVPKRIAHFRSDAVGGRSRFMKSVYLGVSRLLIHIFATDIVGVSPGSLEHGWRANWQSDSRCQVIPNGFDVMRLRAEASVGRARKDSAGMNSEVVLVNVGREDPVKNRGRALAIWAEMAATRKSRLYLVGGLNDEDMKAVPSAQIRGCRGSRVEIVGPSTCVADYIGASDVLLATSTREGLPGVVLEALAIGTPVVVSELPGTKWIASLLPGIEVCSLQSDNAEWIAAIEVSRGKNRSEIAAAFDKSPFLIDHAASSFSRLWGLSV